MVRLAVVGLGKMGLSHLAMIRMHPLVTVEAICDASRYVLDVLSKYSGLRTYSDFEKMLQEVRLDAVVIATPPRFHTTMAKAALERGLHVFCEKPFCLDTQAGEEVSSYADTSGLVNQVGYHNRFVGTFKEVKRLLDAEAIGKVTQVLAEAYGPVVLKPRGETWRTQSTEGGSCVYDYAAHPLNLVNWYFGAPRGVGGSILNSVFSRHAHDEVFSSLYFGDGMGAQVSVSWSDESYRKMSTSITIRGTAGRIYADRQECRAYLRDADRAPAGYQQGWNVRYTTELTEAVWFYVRGEEYSSQLDHFIQCITNRHATRNVNTFADALITDKVIAMLIADAMHGPSLLLDENRPPKNKTFLLDLR